MEIVGESAEMDCDKTIHRYFRNHWHALFPNLGAIHISEASGQSQETKTANSGDIGPASFAERQPTEYCRWFSDASLRLQTSQFFSYLQGQCHLWLLCRRSDALLRFEGISAD